MVIKEKITKTYGSHHTGLNMALASEPDFITLDKTTQTSFEDKIDELTPEKKLHKFLPGKERYYLLKTKSRIQEKASSVHPEFGSFLPKQKQKQDDADKHLDHQDISLQSDKKEFDKRTQTADTTATVTGQILLAVASLRDTDKTSIQAAAVMLNSILKNERNKLRGKVPEIIEIIYFHLRAIQEPSAREAAIGAVCLLAERHTDEAISSLLRLSLLCDRPPSLRAVMKELETIIKSKDVSLEAKAKTILTILFLIIMYTCKSRTVRKASGK